jgi:hypothetical protein
VVNTFSSRSEYSTGGLSSSLPPCYCTVITYMFRKKRINVASSLYLH